MENKNEQKAIEILSKSQAEFNTAMQYSLMDSLVYGEYVLEVGINTIRCIRVNSEEYNKIVNNELKTDKIF